MQPACQSGAARRLTVGRGRFTLAPSEPMPRGRRPKVMQQPDEPIATITQAQRRRTAAGHISHTHLLLYAAALLAGFALRYWLWLDQGRAGMVFLGDPDEYYLGAIHIWLAGNYYDQGQWLRPPLTSLFYALSFALFGPNVPLALLLQVALSAVTALGVGLTARSVWRSERAGIVAAWATALYLPLAVHASLVLSETVFIAAIVLAFWLFEAARRQGMRRATTLLAGGAAFGAAALARPVGLYAVPLLAVWTYLELRSARAAARAALLLVVACAAVIVPWTVRNYVVYHQLVLVDTNGGVSFWFGTIQDPNDQRMQDVWKATLPNSALRQQAAVRLGLENIEKDPWRFISRMRNKTVSLWQPETRLFPSNAVTGVTLAQRSLGFNLAADAEYIVLMLAALVAVAISSRSERNWALLLWPVYGTLLSALTLGHPRLRLPLMVVPLVYAALPLAHPATALRRLRALGRPRLVALLAAVLLWLSLLVSTAYVPFFQGQLQALRGDRAGLTAARRADPNGFLPALELGRVLRAEGDVAGARAAFEQAVAADSRSVEAHVALLRMADERGDTAGAERERAAIDAIGWDQNQTYRWAWVHEGYAAAGGLDLGSAADIGALQGFSRIQVEAGQSLRYTVTRRAQLRLRQSGEPRAVLRIRAAVGAVPLVVRVNGAEALRTTLDAEWQELAVPLPSQAAATLVVELDAPVSVASVDQPYPYGVALDWIKLQ